MPEPLNPPTFTSPAWLSNPHAQTLWPALVRRPPRVRQVAERLALPDGGVLNLVWGPDPAGGPLVLILHGLAGSARSTYVLALKAALAQAVVVSAPLRLAECARRLDQGFARLYQWAMVCDLKAMLRRKRAAGCAPPQIEAALRVRSLWAFDDRLTAPLHGFAGAADYYRRCAPEQRLDGIRVPTLMINAADDPFCPAATLPPPGALSPWVRLALSPGGGHLGFVHGRPWRPRYWLEPTLVERLRAGFSRPRAGAG
ncbi:YheT family hydrolase [Alkalilimnicola ehrlichii]|uniref:YheT family hydrolase n=1 Tax=Alkalilimnicola ehrlichii TaxID=351052 RepID=UPI003BA395D9